MRRTIFVAVIAVIAIGGLVITSLQDGSTDNKGVTLSNTVTNEQAANDSGEARVVLDSLPTKGRAPKTDYSRAQFDADWDQVGGCDVRNHILARDMSNVSFKSATDCTVLSGVLLDPYTGNTINFVRGQGTSEAVQIDHVVALSDAWQKGAQGLSPELRRQFANDSLNLLAVDGPTNQKKSDGDAATWLPPNKDYRCRYVARQIAVKHKYGLWVTDAEKQAITQILASCPGQLLPVVGDSTPSVPQ